jgi:energy-coupling factor transport system permease protein
MLASRDPLARLGAAAAFLAVATFSVSIPTLGGIAALMLALLVLVERVPLRRLATPLLFIAFFAATSSWIYAAAPNAEYRALAGGGWAVGALVALRIVAVGLVSATFALTTAPGDLARQLTQRWGLPQRFVHGALAAVQFMPGLADEARMARMIARSAEATGDGGLAARWRLFAAGWRPGLALTLLAGAIRRASAAALAMQLRGLTATSPPSRWGRRAFDRRDAVFMAIAGAALALLLSL